jgi:hypothetical protein
MNEGTGIGETGPCAPIEFAMGTLLVSPFGASFWGEASTWLLYLIDRDCYSHQRIDRVG